MAPRAPGLHGLSRWGRRLRLLLLGTLVGMLVFSVYGTIPPASVRCGLPGAVDCPGGLFGPAVVPAGSGTQWFTVTMNDWGFYIVNAQTGANETNSWNVFEGWTVHINATSLPPNVAIGGTAYHGLGVEINATGQQLLSLAAPVGKWSQGSFIAPTAEYHHQHIWCTIQCGPGHGNQQAWILNVIPPVPSPTASASANVTYGSAPLDVAFTGVAGAGTAPYTESWNFGDGSATATGLSTTHTYTLGGDYGARFTVTDSKGMVASATVSIVVNSTASLSAQAAALPASGVAPFTSQVSAVAHGGVPPYSFQWNFGDGAVASGTNLTSHLYAAAGVYAVTASVVDSVGASVRALTAVTVIPPSGSFPVTATANPPNGSAPIQIQFNATPNGGVGPYTYLWVFGDGSSAQVASINHQYNLTGAYVANLFVTDSHGAVGTATISIPVVPTTFSGGGGDGGDGGNDTSPSSGAGPVPAASALTIFPLANPMDGGAPLAINASASVEAGTGAGVAVQWSFGDGSTATGQVVSHQYSGVGSYTISVTATDSGGNTGTNSTTVHVVPLAMTVTLNQSVGDAPLTLSAAPTVIGGTGRYGAISWDWGDGTSTVGTLVNHTYPANLTGALTISATTTDSGGASVTATATAHVDPLLLATVGVVMPAVVALPANVSFILNVTGGDGNYSGVPLWNFGDNSSTRTAGPTNHTYTAFGIYRVSVVTNDSLGMQAVGYALVNLSKADLPSPTTPLPGGGGPAPWTLQGVSDPNRAALILMGMVAVSGLGLLYRRRRRKLPPKSTPARPSPSRGAAAVRAKSTAGEVAS